MPRPGEFQKPISHKESSGADKKRKRQKIQKENELLAHAAKKYFKMDPELTPKEQTATNNTNSKTQNEEILNDKLDDGTNSKLSTKPSQEELEDVSENVSENVPITVTTGNNFYDPSTWNYPMTKSLQTAILIEGPKQMNMDVYPRDGKYSFHASHFMKKTKTSDSVHRNWLLYSKSTNSLFCFPCCLFSSANNAQSPWVNFGKGNEGFKSFKHQARAISKHENSNCHFSSVLEWSSFDFNQRRENLIDSSLQFECRKEIAFWTDVLKVILEAVLYLSKNNLAFIGKSKNIQDLDCGNFLSLIKLLSKYSAPLALHVSRLEKNKLSYLSTKIQNEFISAAGETVRKKILTDIRERKYFAIMFDATPDSSHMEQMSQIIRTVKVSKQGCSIEESFIDFVHCDEKTGKLITEAIINKLETDNIDLTYCRAQGYDNASNMAGKYQGVQTRIKEKCPYAEYIPCAAHSLNLVGQNAATRVLPAKLLLGQIQNFYVFFSGSPTRWSMLKKYVKNTLKGNSATRWSAKSDAIHAMYEEFESVGECLTNMMISDVLNAQTVAEAHNRYTDLWNFRFLLGLTIWNFIISRIQVCNLALQSKDVDIEKASKHLCGTLSWLKEFKTTGFEKSLTIAKDKAHLIGIDTESGFEQRITRNKLPQRFRDGGPPKQLTNIERFESDFFHALLDSLIAEFENRFQALNAASEVFGFLWGDKLEKLSEEELTKKVENLSAKYKNDFCLDTFKTEIIFLKSAITEFIEKGKCVSDSNAMEILNILTMNNLEVQFINCHTALRIFLTLPVSVATNERAFSKLKLIKNYLRSTMSQDRLSNLSILSIEREYVETTSFDDIIQEFASKKHRKVPLPVISTE